MLTPKENYMEALRFGKPEYVPYLMDSINMVGMMPNLVIEAPRMLAQAQGLEKAVDAFGVEWIGNEDGDMPVNDHYLLEDITRWKEVVTIPDVEKYPWEQWAEEELSKADPDKANWCIMNNGLFDRLCDCMGFEEGLIAMFEEPEACKEFFHAVADYKIAYIDKLCQYYKPDVIQYVDDVAHARGLFMSPETYRELIKPEHKRIIQAIRSHGVFAEQHTCGKPNDIIDDYVEIGVQSWFPAQPSNDLDSIHREHKLAFNYGMDSQGVLTDFNVSEEVLREETRKAVELYADGGGLVLFPVILGGSQNLMIDGSLDRRQAIIRDELQKCGKYTD